MKQNRLNNCTLYIAWQICFDTNATVVPAAIRAAVMSTPL